MERIVIEVNKTTAKKWRESSKPKRKEIVTLLNEALNDKTLLVEEPVLGYERPTEKESEKHFKDVQKRLPPYKAFLEGTREKAKANGLTEEILEAILKKGA